MTIATPTPTRPSILNAEIPRRHINFEFKSNNSPRYYYANDPFLSAFWGTMSSLFPAGERFFVDSVRHYRDRIDNPKLLTDVQAFIGQEALHSQAHENFDAMLEDMGYPVKQLEKQTATVINLFAKPLPKIVGLAATVCLEHFTATIAEQLLRNEKHRDMADPELLKLWLWHAVEENEHKSVAYDVYRAVGGSEYLRMAVMLPTVVILAATVATFQYKMLKADAATTGRPIQLKNVASGINYLIGRKGLFTSLAPQFLDFFKRDFHPTQHDTVELLAQWRETLFGAKGSITPLVRKIH